jgi:YD repeat-containing protein
VVATTDVRGTQTTFTYDAAGRTLQVAQAAGTPLTTTSYTCYDKGGRTLRTIQNYRPQTGDPAPDARDTGGDWLFNPAAHGLANDENLITTYTLDKIGWQVTVSDPLGNLRHICKCRVLVVTIWPLGKRSLKLLALRVRSVESSASTFLAACRERKRNSLSDTLPLAILLANSKTGRFRLVSGLKESHENATNGYSPTVSLAAG